MSSLLLIVLSLVFVISLLFLILGMISPRLALFRAEQKEQTRKMVFKIYGSVMMLSIVGGVAYNLVFQEDVEQVEPISTDDEIAAAVEKPQVETEEDRIAREKAEQEEQAKAEEERKIREEEEAARKAVEEAKAEEERKIREEEEAARKVVEEAKAEEERKIREEEEAARKAEEEAKAVEEAAARAEQERINNMTLSQKNARNHATNYLRMGGFSRQSLIDQLEYEGYSSNDAAFAVDTVDVDWNEQAAIKAKSYLEYTSFSRAGLYEQLRYEGFTDAQIEFALTAVGY